MTPKEINNFISLHDGCTYNVHLCNMLSGGYAIAIKGFEEQILLKEFDEEKIELFLKKNSSIFRANQDYCLGAWVNDGKVYLDISKVISSYSAAHNYCVANNEIAFFDLEKCEEITVNPDRDSQ